MGVPTQQVDVCASEDLAERHYLKVDLLYRGSISSVLVFRFNGRVLAYLNRCAHMDKALDCESDTIFDEDGKLLRCSMHGALYDPQSGAALGNLCGGRGLQALRIYERDGRITLNEKWLEMV